LLLKKKIREPLLKKKKNTRELGISMYGSFRSKIVFFVLHKSELNNFERSVFHTFSTLSRGILENIPEVAVARVFFG
jgi:hypothetical protein